MPSAVKSKSRSKVVEQDALNKSKVLLQYVQTALADRVRDAQSPTYHSFVKELQALRRKLETAHDAAAEFSFVSLIQALRDCASVVKEGSHDAVLTTVLSTSLWTCSSAVRRAVLEMVVELISTSTTFISNCLQVLLYNLLPPPGNAHLQPEVPGEPWVVHPLAREVQGAVVDAIEQAVQLVPALPSRLLPMLVQNMPHKLRNRSAQCLYLRAITAICEGRAGATLREGLLMGVVEHLLTIDADIRWEDIVDAPTGYDKEESEDAQDELFDLEGLVDLEIDPDSHPPQHDLTQLHDGFHDPAAFAAAGQHGVRRLQMMAGASDGGAAAAKPPVDETADKLDSLMELTMQHLQQRISAGQLGNAWQTMLRVFESRMIHIHRCKFTQFLLFFLTVHDPERCSSSFTARLMSMLRDNAQPAITRCACAAYLASFLARCALAPKSLVVDVLHKLTAASKQYADAAMQAAHRHHQQQLQQGSQRIGGNGSKSSIKKCTSDAALVLLAGLNDLMGQGPLNGVTPAAAAADGGSNGAIAAIQRHQVFYAMVQALLYLLCYHIQPLLASSGDTEQQQLAQDVRTLVQEQVLPLLSHPLAPLAVCHQAVTAEFVRQALLLGLADAEWEAAALHAVSQHQAALAAAAAEASAIVIGGDGPSGEGGAGQPRVLRPLEVFFPFDPYLLKRSARFLQLPVSYTCFSHGQPHAAGAAGRGSAGAGGDQDVAVDEGDDTSSEDEADWEESLSESGSSGSDSEGEEDLPAAAMHRGARPQRPVEGLLPVGLAAAAQQQGMVLSGPSPPLDAMATSLLSNGMGTYLMGGSYESGHQMYGHGGSPFLGGSPMPMSITPYEGNYMHNMPAQLDKVKGVVAGGVVQ